MLRLLRSHPLTFSMMKPKSTAQMSATEETQTSFAFALLPKKKTTSAKLQSVLMGYRSIKMLSVNVLGHLKQSVLMSFASMVHSETHLTAVALTL